MQRNYLILLISIFFATCVPSQRIIVDTTPDYEEPPPIGLKYLDPNSRWVKSSLKKMTLEEKVAQMVFPRAEGSYISRDDNRWQHLERVVRDRKVGGVVFFAGDVYEYVVHINKLQSLADVPLLVAADFEFGAAMRVRRSTLFPRAMLVGATQNLEYAFQMGRVIGKEARALGVHQVYAPVADVNNNPKNPVINTRSFGENPQLVAAMSASFVEGLQSEGVIATIKHFPGHGDTSVDSHLDLPLLPFNRERLDSMELMAFRQPLKSGALSVMMAHLSVPSLEPTPGLPASLSHNIATKILRGEFGFEGLIVTDALEMKGVTKAFSTSEAVVKAVQAGADAILLPVDVDEAIDVLVEAVRKGIIPEERIDESVRRILCLKEGLGLHRARLVDIDEVFKVVGSADHRRLAQRIARDGVTIVQNKNNLLPIPRNHKRRVMNISISDIEDPTVGALFRTLLSRRLASMDNVRIDTRTTQAEFDSIVQRASRADIIIIHLYVKTRSGENTGMLIPAYSQFLNSLLKLGKKGVIVSFGNPYIVGDFPSADALVVGFSEAETVIEATVEILFGETPSKGKLPIAIPPQFIIGTGVEIPKTALREFDASLVGIRPSGFAEVDATMIGAIKDSVFPGGVILVAKDGIILHNKAYGTHSYEPGSQPMSSQTIFDLASLTKVVSTTSAIMRLVDEGKLRLSNQVAKYLPGFNQGDKSNITISNLLQHNSGLPGWKKFYEICPTAESVMDSIYAVSPIRKPADTTIYSDLGFILLGKLVENVSGTRLDQYVDSVFFKPMLMNQTMFNPPDGIRGQIAPTEIDTIWRRSSKPIQGSVHDENASFLGGVSGHAGLFSTASDLAIFSQMILNGGIYSGQRYLKEETVRLFTKRQSDMSTRALGWDTRNPNRSWSGNLLSPKTFLHTGFTGTSIAIDPDRNLIIILMTNRVHPTRNSEKIHSLRPKVHDAVVKAVSTSTE